jgi:DNA-binding response OmpR family regulator
VRVFVCDDDPDIRGYLRSLFELENWTVLDASSGDALLTAIDLAEPPDAIVLDQMMPGLTGTATAQRLRDAGLTRPIILCSAYLGPELNDQIEQLRLTPVNKLDVEALVRVVRAAVRESRRPVRRG